MQVATSQQHDQKLPRCLPKPPQALTTHVTQPATVQTSKRPPHSTQRTTFTSIRDPAACNSALSPFTLTPNTGSKCRSSNLIHKGDIALPQASHYPDRRESSLPRRESSLPRRESSLPRRESSLPSVVAQLRQCTGARGERVIGDVVT